ncbi:MAG: NAD(P)H-binding protein [Thaumarchaeota archaeon]|nr:NAD(P)H-binding protein [Nitrososphaerota archaeon]
MDRKVAITGASGFVGRNAGSFLDGKGFEVVALVRKGRAGFGRTVVTRDLAEKKLAAQVGGSDALLHLVGTGRQTTESDYETVNVSLTRNAVRLCRRAGIRKIIYLSGLGVGKSSTLGYFISKFKAEQEIIRSGLDYTIFRPSYIMGKGDPLSSMLAREAARGQVVIPGSGKYRMQPIFVDDVSQVVMRAIFDRRFSKKTVDLVGPKAVTYNRLVADLAPRARIRHVEFERAYHEALVSAKGPFGVDDLSILVGGYLGDHKRLARMSKLAFTGYGTMLKYLRE